MLSILDEKAQKDEVFIIEELLACIDCKKSLLFNAGAGAGKTYALVECLKHVCKKKGEILKTYSFCKNIITLNDKTSEAYYLLSLVFLNKNSKLFDLKQAKQIYMKYLELVKEKFNVNFDLAKLFYNKESKSDMILALKLFKKIIETDENNEIVLLNIALIYQDLNDNNVDDNSVIFLKRVLRVNPNNFIALKTLGVYNLNRNNIESFSEGIRYLEQARKIKNDEHTFLYLCVARYIYNEIKRNPSVTQYYLTSPINLNSGNTLFLLGRLYDSGVGVDINLKKSFEYYKKAANLNYVKSFYYVAECYEFGRGTEINMDKAIEYYDKAIFYNDFDAYKALERLNKL